MPQRVKMFVSLVSHAAIAFSSPTANSAVPNVTIDPAEIPVTTFHVTLFGARFATSDASTPASYAPRAPPPDSAATWHICPCTGTPATTKQTNMAIGIIIVFVIVGVFKKPKKREKKKEVG